MGVLQHTPFNVFIAKDPGPDAQASPGLEGPQNEPYQSSL